MTDLDELFRDVRDLNEQKASEGDFTNLWKRINALEEADPRLSTQACCVLLRSRLRDKAKTRVLGVIPFDDIESRVR